MADEKEKPNGDAARPSRVIGITVFFDPDSDDFRVWTESATDKAVPIGMAMMMLDEAQRQFDAARRLATGKELARQMIEQKKTADLTKELSRGMHS
jgi:hypothetical protein